MPSATPRALIADDEDPPRAELRRMLAQTWPALQIVAECEHGPAAIEALDAHAPDVAFLDIRMPGRSGLDVARAASGRCHTVFTTAYDSHAVAAFEAGAVDYLLKPIATDRLAHSVHRLQARLASHSQPPALDPLLEKLAAHLQGKARQGRAAAAALGERQCGRDDQAVQHRRGAVLPERREVHARPHRP
jgi:DNA-binding LytR/AlgR family response regulator